MIKAPFNFVPLSEKVFFPNWANQISQDVPFEDGISGSIDIEITAITPLFVRNGHTRKQAKEKSQEFRTFSTAPDGRYFIPATSIKGCVRNAMEILSFGKMSRINNNRYSIRDLKLKKEYLEQFSVENIHCGWMKKDGETIIIEDHGIPYRISHLFLDLKFNTKFCETFMGAQGNRYLKDDKHRTAINKYRIFGTNSLTNKFKENGFCTKNAAVDKRMNVAFDDNGWDGTIVFTGQPGERKPKEGERKASGKFFEFVFKEQIETIYKLNAEEENGLFQDFCFIYKDSDDWAYWEKALNHGERVPVFMNTTNGKLCHFGLSYLYKLPSTLHLKDYLYENHKKETKDLAECIFGYAGKEDSLKGRVQFSNAFCVKGKLDEENLVYMGSPKPTYYPIYIKQNGEYGSMEKDGKLQRYSTILSSSAELKGWKMYPIRKEAIKYFEIPEGQEENSNIFQPMCSGSVFSGKVLFHNLKKEELAALVYSLQLKNGVVHNLGFAKPFGYGATRFEVKAINGCELNVEDCCKLFESMMSNEVANYTKCKQVKEFFMMSKPQELKPGKKLEYMTLKEFVETKTQKTRRLYNPNRTEIVEAGEYLEYYSEMVKKEEKVVKPVIATAKVDFVSGQLKQAHLINDKDSSKKELIINDKKIKLKIGDTIEVEKIIKGSNVQKLMFVKKI